MDVEEAWEHFLKSDTSFIKTSDSGKLDTISAQMQEMSTDIKRIKDIIPQIQGDRTAMDEGSELDDVLGGDDPESILAGLGGEGGEEVPEEEAEPEAEAEEGAEEEPDEDAVEKAADDDIDTGDLEEVANEPGDDGLVGGDDADIPAPAEVDEEVEDAVPDAEPVESIEPAGQEGLPPEGVPDLTDEINADQPDGLLNVYDRFIEGMRAAARNAVEDGDMDRVTRIAGAQNAMDAIWRDQVAPLIGDGFARSADRIVKSDSDIMEGERMSDDIASSHEVSLSDCSEEGAENTTGHDNSATAPETPNGEVAGTDAPHALNNEDDTSEENPASFEKCDSVEKSADAPDDGQGMEPVAKSLEDLEGYSQDYVDPDPDLDYTDPIRKSVPSFRDVMAIPKEDRFMRVAEMRHGPHKTMDQFLKSWQEEDAQKSMTAGEPMEGTDPVTGSEDFAKDEGAMTAGTEGADNATFSESCDSVEKSMAGEPGPVGNVEDAMKPVSKSAEDQLNDVNAGFEKSTDTGTTPVGDELQGPVCDKEAETGMDDVDSAMKKSQQNGKRLMSFSEMLSFRKSGMPMVDRPGPEVTVNGDTKPIEERDFKKSQTPVVRMGRGVDHRDVVASDWEEYRLYKNQGRF